MYTFTWIESFIITFYTINIYFDQNKRESKKKKKPMILNEHTMRLVIYDIRGIFTPPISI